MVQYYTLEQAAQLLQVTPDKLKEMVKQGKIRAFQDRGTLRFRTQEIDELVRSLGLGSDQHLQPGEAPSGKPAGSSSSSRGRSKASGSPSDDEGSSDFDFNLSPEDDQSVSLDPPKSGAGKSTPTSGGKRNTPPGRPSRLGGPPPRSSDSDVRLVADGSDLNFDLSIDDDAPPVKSPPPARKSRLGPTSKPPSSKHPGSKHPGSKPPNAKSSRRDSSVRLSPPEPGSDSDVKIVPDDQADSSVSVGQPGAKAPSDSDIRLETSDAGRKGNPNRPGSDPVVTEEIDLDLEAKKVESDARKKGKGKSQSPRAPILPTSSPFELSENDLQLDSPPASDELEKPLEDSSSDFELTPLGGSDDELELGSDETLALAGEEVDLGELSGASGASGINLQDPVDSGISLEADGSDEMEFELSLDDGSTPGQAGSPGGLEESNNEFELSLDDEGSGEQDATPPSDSEFELSLDDEGSSDLSLDETDSGSDSEFELTLDEEGGLAPVDESTDLAEEDKDLFEETDFDVPSLDEESGSEAMALEESSELAADSSSEMALDSSSEMALDESSDFDLAVDDSALAEDSESQVVPLGDEEEDADVGAKTVARPLTKGKGKAAADLEDEGMDLDLDAGEESPEDDEEMVEEEDEEGQVRVRQVPVEAEPAPWGVLPVVFMLPCVVILFVVGMMSWEMVQGMWGYHNNGKITGMVINPIARMFDETLPDK